MTPAKREHMFATFARDNPHPKGELVYRNAYELLVAVVLSAQATDRSVNAATAGLFAAAPTPEKMSQLGESGVIEHIRTIGLFRTKARHVVALSRQLIDHHGGQVPNSREALQALPGVGRKTANVVLNIAFQQETIAVDTHCFRVANRTGLAKGKTVDDVEARLLKAVPAPYRLHAHHWLILHGRYVCLARKPQCWRCAIAQDCAHKPKTPVPDAMPPNQALASGAKSGAKSGARS
jgi:endonuclease-3